MNLSQKWERPIPLRMTCVSSCVSLKLDQFFNSMTTDWAFSLSSIRWKRDYDYRPKAHERERRWACSWNGESTRAPIPHLREQYYAWRRRFSLRTLFKPSWLRTPRKPECQAKQVFLHDCERARTGHPRQTRTQSKSTYVIWSMIHSHFKLLSKLSVSKTLMIDCGSRRKRDWR